MLSCVCIVAKYGVTNVRETRNLSTKIKLQLCVILPNEKIHIIYFIFILQFYPIFLNELSRVVLNWFLVSTEIIISFLLL